ncbi:hypothetical protein Tco_1110304 [Tanacetum coccineum]|uniref:Uncharacterized protein n=1 Tax=Tanacetum coccineum TaxID=301880 RepID=A0ABQ5IIE4_9ASTR
MSDSKDSTVTYTEVSSPFGDLSDIGSPRVDGLPMMPDDPYAYVVAAFQAPPSPDYVHGPEEPDQAPPSPKFVPEPVYPEFMSPKDEDEEDPEEDPADYPVDGGDDDDDDDDESFDDDEDDDDDVEEDEDEEEEEEHPALADSFLPPVHSVTARMPILSPLLPVSPPLLPVSPTYPLGYKAAMIRLRAETPSTFYPLPLSTSPSGTPPLLPIPLPTSSPHLVLPSNDCRAGVSEVTLPP